MASDIGLDMVLQKATRPASKWRNKWLILQTYVSKQGRFHTAGDEWWSPCEYPSRDIAETKGHRWEANNPGVAKYLGAFPMGDA